MAKTLKCIRCEQTKEGLESPPLGGALGQRVLNEICADCWKEWQETSGRLINHYQLVLADPEARSQLRMVMKQFLRLDEAAEAQAGPGQAQ